MNLVLDAPILGLGAEFPTVLHIIRHPHTGRCGIYAFDGVHGLACFSTESHAEEFRPMIEGHSELVVETVSFDEAREVAKGRPLPVVAIMLCDDLSEPIIHFVK